MDNFKIGDRVIVVTPADSHFENNIGTVIDIRSQSIGIQFDNSVLGHNCNGKGLDGHCYYFLSNRIKHAEKNITPLRIRWYSKGNFSNWEDNNNG